MGKVHVVEWKILNQDSTGMFLKIYYFCHNTHTKECDIAFVKPGFDSKLPYESGDFEFDFLCEKCCHKHIMVCEECGRVD